MRSGKGVRGLGDRRKAGKMPIKRQPEAFAVRMAECLETSFSAALDFSIWRDVLDGALERGQRNFRILRGYFLVRRICHPLPGELLPIAHPVDAESAITVIDQKRLAPDRVCCSHGARLFLASQLERQVSSNAPEMPFGAPALFVVNPRLMKPRAPPRDWRKAHGRSIRSDR